MTTLTPPAYSKVATPAWEVATVGELWALSDHLGVPTRTILRALNEDKGSDA